MRATITLLYLLLCSASVTARNNNYIVADSASHTPLPGASVFDRRANFVGATDSRGRMPYVAPADYPVTLRFLGYRELLLDSIPADTVFLAETPTLLREVTVSTRQQKVLHLLGYVREYSTLSTYTDTITLFREKMVDFMHNPDKHVKFTGWATPRILKSKSYYRFTNAEGLDSVSDVNNQHFSWSDWIGMVSSPRVIPGRHDTAIHTDTVMGKYTPREIWNRRDDKATVEIDVLADSAARRWVPGLAGFFRRNLDFERFRVRYNFDNLAGDTIEPADLSGYSFSIESNGRGREMFMFNHVDEPVFVSTYTEVYIVDKEYITVKEAKKWAARNLNLDEVEIMEPPEAPELQESVKYLVARVDAINREDVRRGLAPDQRLISKYDSSRNFKIGNRALSMLKQLTGITLIKSHKNFNSRWSDFKHSRTSTPQR